MNSSFRTSSISDSHESQINVLSLPFDDQRIAEISLPTKLTEQEFARLIEFMNFMKPGVVRNATMPETT